MNDRKWKHNKCLFTTDIKGRKYKSFEKIKTKAKEDINKGNNKIRKNEINYDIHNFALNFLSDKVHRMTLKK